MENPNEITQEGSKRSEAVLDESEKSKIFWREATKRFKIYKLKADKYLNELHIAFQVDTISKWIKEVDRLFESDIDKFLENNYLQGYLLELYQILVIKFTGDQFVYFLETKKIGYNFSAIKKSNFNECLIEDTAMRQNLNYQIIIAEITLLKKYFINTLNILEKSTGIKTHGFSSKLTEVQIKRLFDQLIGKYIDKTTNPDCFRAIFKNYPLPEYFEPVKWILKGKKNQPHKTALREFLNLILEKIPNQKDIDVCIADIYGKPIHLAKPKKEPNTDYWTAEFMKMLS